MGCIHALPGRRTHRPLSDHDHVGGPERQEVLPGTLGYGCLPPANEFADLPGP